MKTAVLYSGHMRSFARCLATQRDHVFRHFGECDFFVSTVRDEDSPTAELLREKFPKSRVEIEVLDCQPEIPIPVPPIAADWQAGQGRLYGHEPYAISVHPQAILRQLWHLQRVWEFACWQISGGAPQIPDRLTGYGTIIRMRADNYFRSFNSALVTRHSSLAAGTALTPLWGRFGGINDRFAILGADAAKAYFTTFARVADLLAKGYPLHPERLIYASLVESSCTVDDSLSAWFSKLVWDRSAAHGTFRDPEVTHVDIVDAQR